MNPEHYQSRRDFLKDATALTAGSALAGLTIPHVHAAGTDTVHLALIGCGGRGSGAAANAFDSPNGPVKMTVMADLFPDRLEKAHKALSAKYADKMDVPADRRFIGFDAYRKAIDSLRPGDVAMLTGYSGFRALQLEYAVERGINVFMEKSFGPDVPSLRRLMKAGEAAEKKNLKIAAGLQCRHSINRAELLKRMHAGELGETQLIRAYRMQGIGNLPKRPETEKDLFWQIRNFTKFLWVSGGLFAEMNIHQIDEIVWLMGDQYPISAHGTGGRAPESTDCSQNFDNLNIEYTFADGTKAYDVVRWVPNCYPEFATYVHGSKCSAQFSGISHVGTVQIYKNRLCANDNIAWRAPKEQYTPWEAQWNDFLDAIRKDRPFNQAKRAGMSNLVDLMGRAAVHSGKTITWEQILASNFQFCPNIDQLNENSTPPVQADAQGRYPVPVPGKWTEV